jgi:transcriptional regulator with XRE-family HTH domain
MTVAAEFRTLRHALGLSAESCARALGVQTSA